MRGLSAVVMWASAVLWGAVPAFAQNTMEIDDVTIAPGTPFSTIIRLTHVDPAGGYQTAVTYDSSIVTLNDMDTIGLDVESLLAPETIEFFFTHIDPNIAPGLGWGVAAAVFDNLPPFNDQTLPPGAQQSVVRYSFDTIDDSLLIGTCTDLELTDGFGVAPGVDNIITVNTLTVRPTLVNGQLCFVELPVFLARRGIAGFLGGPVAQRAARVSEAGAGEVFRGVSGHAILPLSIRGGLRWPARLVGMLPDSERTTTGAIYLEPSSRSSQRFRLSARSAFLAPACAGLGLLPKRDGLR